MRTPAGGLWIWFVPAVALAVNGCGVGPRLADVQGVVKVKGAPLAGVVVEFLPDPEKGVTGPKSLGFTDAEGRFTLRTDGNQPGAVLGWHRVVLEDPDEDRPPQGQPARKLSRIPLAFAHAATTPFRREVKESKNTFDLDLSQP